tara:strand:- start:28 stop:402 length:375 start_codon:yes stop_codon:yes gene_type:complete
MSELKLCQGPSCHTYHTKDRLKGPKGNKTYQTRRRSGFYYGGNNFCSFQCYNDWFNTYGDRAIDHFGRTTEPKHLTEQNAWVKGYDWDHRTDECHHHIINKITLEQRPLTRQQYDDNNYTLNER